MPRAAGSSYRSSTICIRLSPVTTSQHGPGSIPNMMIASPVTIWRTVLKGEHHRIRCEAEEDAADRLVMRLAPLSLL
jgi:hypothetical protein